MVARTLWLYCLYLFQKKYFSDVNLRDEDGLHDVKVDVDLRLPEKGGPQGLEVVPDSHLEEDKTIVKVNNFRVNNFKEIFF